MKKLQLLLAGGLALSSMMAYSQDSGKKNTAKASSSSQKKPAPKPNATEAKLNNKIDSVSYSLGILITQNLQQEGLDNLNPDAMAQAIKDVYSKQGKFDNKQAESIVMNYSMEAKQLKAQKNVEEGQKFLEENKKKQGVVTLPSGLQYMILKQGDGPKPTANDVVTTHYHGTLINGTVFDSSVDRGEPASFKVNGVIPGWVEALQLMPVGSKWRLFIPADLAYGERGAGGSIGPNSTLIFDVELISIGQK